MNKSTGIFLLVLLLTGVSALAQSNLKTGYVITLAGDTVHGFVDYNDWSANPSKVHFKKTIYDEGVFYDPYDIKLFSIENDIYEGGFVDVELSSRDINNLSDSPNLYLEKQLVFLQQLVKGRKSLYSNDNGLYSQFYVKSDTAFELLVYKIYLKETKSVQGITQNVKIENKKFQGQLIVYFSDCPDIQDVISKTSYNEESMKRVFKRYYECRNENFETLEPKRNLAIRFGVCYGVAFSGVDFEVNEFKESDRTNFTVRPYGAILEISRQISHPEWSLYNEINISGDFNLHEEVIDEDPSYYYRTTTNYKFVSFKLLNLIRYYVKPQREFTPFVNLGIATDLYDGTWTRTTNGTVLGQPVHQTKSKPKSFFTERLVGGVGVKYWRFTLEGRFETGSKKVGPVTSFMLGFTF